MHPRLSAAVLALVLGGAAAAEMNEPLTGRPGDPASGRAIVTEPQKSLCLLCHAGPFPEVPFMGDLGPDLAGVGDRLTTGELRERIVDSRLLNPDTVMPPFYSQEGLNRVGPRWQHTTILTAQEVEDVTAFLATLKGGSE